MDVNTNDNGAVARIAAAIGEPARTRILYSLLDGRARTSTELAVVAGVSPSTASVHLHRLQTTRLLKVHAQGKHRYYSLEGPDVGRTLEKLSILAGAGHKFVPNTPSRLRSARTCYDHLAGSLAVALHDRMGALGWLRARSQTTDDAYDVTPIGVKGLQALGVDLEATRKLRRRFAYACLDWSERRPHLGGALGATILRIALKRKWVIQDLDSRALEITPCGRREMATRFGLSGKSW